MPRFVAPKTPALKTPLAYKSQSSVIAGETPVSEAKRVEQNLERAFGLAISPPAKENADKPESRQTQTRTKTDSYDLRMRSPWGEVSVLPQPSRGDVPEQSSKFGSKDSSSAQEAVTKPIIRQNQLLPRSKGCTLDAPHQSNKRNAASDLLVSSKVDVSRGVEDLIRKLSMRALKPDVNEEDLNPKDASALMLQRMQNSFRPCWGPGGMVVSVAPSTIENPFVAALDKQIDNDIEVVEMTPLTQITVSKIDICPQIPPSVKRSYNKFLSQSLSDALHIHARLGEKAFNEHAKSQNAENSEMESLPWFLRAARPIKPSETSVRDQMDEFVERILLSLNEKSLVPGSAEFDTKREWTRCLALIRGLVIDKLFPSNPKMSSVTDKLNNMESFIDWLRHSTSNSLKRRLKQLDQFESLLLQTNSKSPGRLQNQMGSFCVRNGCGEEVLLGARVFALLSHLHVTEALEVARKGGDMHLALLISRAGAKIVDPLSECVPEEKTDETSSLNIQVTMSSQIQKWISSGQWSLMERWHKRIYALLAGDFVLLDELFMLQQTQVQMQGQGVQNRTIDDDMCAIPPALQHWTNQLALALWTLSNEEWRSQNPASVVVLKLEELSSRCKLIQPLPEFAHGYLTPNRFYNRPSAAIINGNTQVSVESNAYVTDRQLWFNVQSRRVLTHFAADPSKTTRQLQALKKVRTATSQNEGFSAVLAAQSLLGSSSLSADRKTQFNLLSRLTRGHIDPLFSLLKQTVCNIENFKTTAFDTLQELVTAPIDSPASVDVALQWLVSEALTPAFASVHARETGSWEFLPLAPRYQRVLTGSFIAQLELLGLWHWAIYVALRSVHLHPLERRRLVQELISRHVFEAAAGDQMLNPLERTTQLREETALEFASSFFDEGDFTVVNGTKGSEIMMDVGSEASTLAVQLNMAHKGGSERLNFTHPFSLCVKELDEKSPEMWKNFIDDALARQFNLQIEKDSSADGQDHTYSESAVMGESRVIELIDPSTGEQSLDVYFPATELTEDTMGAGSLNEGDPIDYNRTLRLLEKTMKTIGVKIGPSLESEEFVGTILDMDEANQSNVNEEFSELQKIGVNAGRGFGTVIVSGIDSTSNDCALDFIPPPALVCGDAEHPHYGMQTAHSFALEEDGEKSARRLIPPTLCMSMWSLTPGLSAYACDGGSRLVPKLSTETRSLFNFICNGIGVPRSWIEEACAFADVYRSMLFSDDSVDQFQPVEYLGESYSSAMVRYLRSGKRSEALHHFALRKFPQWLISNRMELVEQVLLRNFARFLRKYDAEKDHNQHIFDPVFSYSLLLLSYVESKTMLRALLLEYTSTLYGEVSSESEVDASQLVVQIHAEAVKLEQFVRQARSIMRLEGNNPLNTLQRSALVSLIDSAGAILDEVKRSLGALESGAQGDDLEKGEQSEEDTTVQSQMSLREGPKLELGTMMRVPGQSYLDSIASSFDY